MADRIRLLCCHNFRPELEAAVAAEGWGDVSVAEFPARCGRPPLAWDELEPLLGGDSTQVFVIGRSCLAGLDETPPGWPPLRLVRQGECFELVAGASLVADAIARGAYLMTPSWLDDWPGKLHALGFSEADAAGFFQDFAKELLLLDTGLDAGAPAKLAALAEIVGLPATRLAVGLDYTRLLLSHLVTGWRLEQENLLVQARERDRARELADHIAAMDVTGRLVLLKDEDEVIAAIEEVFRMLFAPDEFHYLRFENGHAPALDTLPAELSRQLAGFTGDWAWCASGAGFMLRIQRGDETLAVVVVDRLAFPNYRDRYLNLAMSLAGVCGLAIENARAYRLVKATEEALRKSEFSLKIAQSIAHLGHWEWDTATEEMKWSDETYRILGYEPHGRIPSREGFFEVIHPDDREHVAALFGQARGSTSFDLEFRILPPNGGVRMVHGVGTTLPLGTGLIGTIQDVTKPGMAEVLGVIQDITERKELELKLLQEAHTDALTGCANRRYFLELGQKELVRHHRYGGELSLLALDLDHFKSVNDRFGHPIGDRTLRKLVDICRATLREEDVVGRLGGEEFAVLLPETGMAMALEVAERLRQAIADAEVPVDGGPPLRFTTSIGVATVAASEIGIDAPLGRADQALYLAKNSGRNRVAAAPPA